MGNWDVGTTACPDHDWRPFGRSNETVLSTPGRDVRSCVDAEKAEDGPRSRTRLETLSVASSAPWEIAMALVFDFRLQLVFF